MQFAGDRSCTQEKRKTRLEIWFSAICGEILKSKSKNAKAEIVRKEKNKVVQNGANALNSKTQKTYPGEYKNK